MAAPPFSRSDAVANRARLIEAARAVFAEHGAQAEMKEIADRAGVGIGTIYRNFATKDDLLSAIIDEQILNAIGLIELSQAQFSVSELLPNLLAQLLAQAEQNAALCQAVMGGPGVGFEPPANFELMLKALEAPIRAAQVAGVCRPDLTPQFLALYLASQFQNYLLLRERVGADIVREGVMKLFLAGVAPQGGSHLGNPELT